MDEDGGGGRLKSNWVVGHLWHIWTHNGDADDDDGDVPGGCADADQRVF